MSDNRGWPRIEKNAAPLRQDWLKYPKEIIHIIHRLGSGASKKSIADECSSERRETVYDNLNRLVNDGLIEVTRGVVDGKATEIYRLKPDLEYRPTEEVTFIFRIAEKTTEWFDTESVRLGKKVNVNYEKIKQKKAPEGELEIYGEFMTIYSHTILIWHIAELAMLHSQSLSARKSVSYPMYYIGQITNIVTSHYWGDVETLRIDEVMERWRSAVFSNPEEKKEWERLVKDINLEMPKGVLGIRERQHLANIIFELQKESLPDGKAEP